MKSPHQRHAGGISTEKGFDICGNGDEHTCDEAVSHLRLKLGIPVTALTQPSSLLIRLLRRHDYREAVYCKDPR